MTEKEFQEELEKRITLMESGKPGIRPMKKKDYIQVAVFAGICLLGIIVGAFL